MNFLYRRLTTRQLYLLGVAVPLLCTLAMAFLQYHLVKDMLRTRDLARHARSVQLALDVFRYSISDAESSQFRYALTGDTSNIELYHKQLAVADAQFQELRNLTVGDIMQQGRLAQAEKLYQTKVASMDESFRIKRIPDVDLNLNGGTLVSLESILQQMENAEAQVLLQRQALYQRKFEAASELSVASMVLCLLFIIAIILLLRRMAHLQSFVTLCALSEMIEYEGGLITIEEYLKRRHQALAKHGQAQIEAERILGLLGETANASRYELSNKLKLPGPQVDPTYQLSSREKIVAGS